MVNETEGGIMLDTKMQGAINEQINWELYSGYLYLSMAAQFSELGMPGGHVTLEAIAKPQTEWAVGLDMFKDALAHEEKVTARIFDLASMALELKDHATHNFLQWFIAEQVEEEESANDMVQKFTMAGDQPAGLYQLDKELAARVFTPPAPAA